MSEIRPDQGCRGVNVTNDHSPTYGYCEYAADWMTLWDVPTPDEYSRFAADIGLDHFVLTFEGDFDRVEFRVMGYTIDELRQDEA